MTNEIFINDNFGWRTYAYINDGIVTIKLKDQQDKDLHTKEIPLLEMRRHQEIMNILDSSNGKPSNIEIAISSIQYQMDKHKTYAENLPSQFKNGVVEGLSLALNSLKELKERIENK